ncbi:Fc.00g006190.m01.CDS01 [Cosmosporella sp. VM-42]
MPCFRGVDVSIFTQSDPGRLPEFSHPDASSVRLLPPLDWPPSPQSSGPAGSSDSDSTHIQKASPRISVYIPSIPGSQFWFHYSIQRVPEPPCQLYFKISMNGRPIANWGINPAANPSGSVTRALYEPCDRWHYKEDDIVLKREGIEARYFHFLPTSDSISVAEDGGVIEVQVFRARGRKRKAPVLVQHRSQESYGISSPSGGLLDCPEDASYYDWLLIDPSDSPFASFRFHYRSWTNLRQLSLVPPYGDSGPTSIPTRNSPVQRRNEHPNNGKSESGNNFLRLPGMLQELAVKCDGGGIARDLSMTEVHRPLPEIPGARSVSRKSLESYAPSIAPSLLPYIEEDMAEGDDVEYGMATQVPIRADSLPTRAQEHRPAQPPRGQLFRHETTAFTPRQRLWPLEQHKSAQDRTTKPDVGPPGQQVQDEVFDDIPQNITSGEDAVLSIHSGFRGNQPFLSEGEWMKGCFSYHSRTDLE